ncbi:hypothetical protein CVT24_000697 [Panaeolus cyanescens]|uniref:F-box domain-containing protein n=1 Tax=Panaeolus cyanescens TaxID=181874 RepID=A0A409YY26_9AGAR|nr:hypothetical protein CVT24_000697 [Panaeolus cyanescens]
MMDDLPAEILDTILEHGLDEEDENSIFEERKTLLNWTTEDRRSFLSVNRRWNKRVCHNINMWTKIVLVAHRNQCPQRALEYLDRCLSRRGRCKYIALLLQLPDNLNWRTVLPLLEATMQPYSQQIKILELNPSTRLHLEMSGLKHLIIRGSSMGLRPCFTGSPNLEIAHNINGTTYHSVLLSSLNSIRHLDLSLVDDQTLLQIIQEAPNLESLSIDTVKVNPNLHKIFRH